MITQYNFLRTHGILDADERPMVCFEINAMTPHLGSYEPDHADFFSLILIEEGEAHYVINGTEVTLGVGSMLVVSPRVLMCMLSFSNDFRAMHVVIDTQCLEGLVTQEQACHALAVYFSSNELPVVECQEADVAIIRPLMTQLAELPQRCGSEHLDAMMRHLLLVLLMQVAGMVDVEEDKAGMSGRELIYRNFIELMMRYYHREHSTRFYADALNITPVYLARIVKERAQTTVKALILNLLYKDACTLLRHGNMPITAVSEALGFADLETFSKFFKRYAGMAPSKYISIHNSQFIIHNS